LAASNRFSSGDQIALTSTGGGVGSDMHVMASASLDGLSSTSSNSHPAFHSFPGGEINSNSTSSASSEFGDNLVRPENLTVVGGAQSGRKVNYKWSTQGRDSIDYIWAEQCRNSTKNSLSSPDDKGLIPIDSMGHSATIPAITKLEDALEYIEGVDNGEGGELGSVGSNGSPYDIITKPKFDWIDRNNMEYNIRSMGEIISGMSDLAISISADEVESWVNEAMEILHEKIPRVIETAELTHIDYDKISKDMQK
jgi:hypothetical protein